MWSIHRFSSTMCVLIKLNLDTSKCIKYFLLIIRFGPPPPLNRQSNISHIINNSNRVGLGEK
ncbi:hypothetical protein GBA52_023438 [Prunus armeniaca]|nr:hypothetical protein GBA52_023438 [Prunus armeniaca]